MLGDIEKQHPLIMFYYASSIYFKDKLKKKRILYRIIDLFEKVYLIKKKHF